MSNQEGGQKDEEMLELLRQFVEWYEEYWWEITTAEITVLAILWVLVIAKNCSEVTR